MNEKQISWLRIGILVIVLMGIFPPTRRDYRPDLANHPSRYRQSPLKPKPIRFTPELYGYTFLLGAKASDIAFKRLIIQWGVVGVLTLSLIYTFRHEKQKDEQKE